MCNPPAARTHRLTDNDNGVVVRTEFRPGDGLGCFIAYYVDDNTGSFDFKRIVFGHGVTRQEAIRDLKVRSKYESLN